MFRGTASSSPTQPWLRPRPRVVTSSIESTGRLRAARPSSGNGVRVLALKAPVTGLPQSRLLHPAGGLITGQGWGARRVPGIARGLPMIEGRALGGAPPVSWDRTASVAKNCQWSLPAWAHAHAPLRTRRCEPGWLRAPRATMGGCAVAWCRRRLRIPGAGPEGSQPGQRWDGRARSHRRASAGGSALVGEAIVTAETLAAAAEFLVAGLQVPAKIHPEPARCSGGSEAVRRA